MIIGILKENKDNRVAMTPIGIEKSNYNFIVEQGAGTAAHFSNTNYTASAKLVARDELLGTSDILIGIHPISEQELSLIKPKSIFIANFAPFNDPNIAISLKKHNIHGISMDMIPRTTLAQSMDVLSSMASIAGYRAVIRAAEHLPRYFPMMMTAAGSIRPCTVVVLGAGVAGLQAIATAKRLGAVVEAFDVRSAAKEEVLSLGAKFIEIEGAKDDTKAGGYAVEQSEEYIRRQQEEVQRRAAKADVIITTAQVRGRKAPTLITQDTVEKMKSGSVIVDLAASTGGNCELTKNEQVYVHQGVKIIGNSNLANDMPQDASTMYSNNILNLLKLIIDKEETISLKHEIVQAALITK